MYYIIYKTTNLINGRFYIGKHQTSDLYDDYVGSGKLLKRAIKKYGIDNFKTEIVEMCPTEAHMNLAEKIYVIIDSEVSYNLCRGGKGGFGYINSQVEERIKKNKKARTSTNKVLLEKYGKDWKYIIGRKGSEAAQNSIKFRNEIEQRKLNSNNRFIALYDLYIKGNYKNLSQFRAANKIKIGATRILDKWKYLGLIAGYTYQKQRITLI